MISIWANFIYVAIASAIVHTLLPASLPVVQKILATVVIFYVVYLVARAIAPGTYGQ